MLAAEHPYQHQPLQQKLYTAIDIPSPAPSLDSFYDSNATSSISEKNRRIPRTTYDPSIREPQNTTSGSSSQSNDQFMTDAYTFQNPSIRVQQYSPNRQQEIWEQLSNAASHEAFLNANGGMQSTSIHQPLVRRTQAHQRAQSSSSMASSNSPASPYGTGHATKSHFPQYQTTGQTSTHGLPINKSESFFGHEDNRAFSNHLPTPSQTPTQDSFLASSHPAMYNTSTPGFEPTISAHNAMRQALLETSSMGDDGELPPFSHSTRHSVSSLGHNSPITPHTVNEDDFDDGLKAPSNDNMQSNLYGNVDFSEAMYPQQSVAALRNVPRVNTNNLLSPSYRTVNERLQAAQNARVHKSPLTPSRDASPFRQNSPYVRQEQKPDMLAFQQQQPQEGEQPKTISPKDAVLEYHESEEDSKAPLFPESGANDFEFMGGNAAQSTSAQDFNLATSSAAAWSQPSVTSSQFATSAPFSNGFGFGPTSMPNMNMGYRQPNGYMSAAEDTPAFPASLPTMETSVSDVPDQSDNGYLSTEQTPASSQQGQLMQHQTSSPARRSPPTQRPSSTLADSGTYSCTYHGCPQRFSTPQKLQKHKRDAHRQHPNGVTPGIGSGMSPAELMARNSQSGPHRCDRINPTTGKPCGVVFSRPYDLTRHEDTIHNNRKQKVRCALCVEDKTFSRSDALTRHMRVVHPEVDFPGKHRRRGGARS